MMKFYQSVDRSAHPTNILSRSLFTRLIVAGTFKGWFAIALPVHSVDLRWHFQRLLESLSQSLFIPLIAPYKHTIALAIQSVDLRWHFQRLLESLSQSLFIPLIAPYKHTIALAIQSVDRRWHFQRLVRRGFLSQSLFIPLIAPYILLDPSLAL